MSGALAEPCFDGHCDAPVACGGWGYCRERNSAKGVDPCNSKTVARFREYARSRELALRYLSAFSQAWPDSAPPRITPNRERGTYEFAGQDAYGEYTADQVETMVSRLNAQHAKMKEG